MFERAVHPGEILPFGGLVCGAGTHVVGEVSVGFGVMPRLVGCGVMRR